MVKVLFTVSWRLQKCLFSRERGRLNGSSAIIRKISGVCADQFLAFATTRSFRVGFLGVQTFARVRRQVRSPQRPEKTPLLHHGPTQVSYVAIPAGPAAVFSNTQLPLILCIT